MTLFAVTDQSGGVNWPPFVQAGVAFLNLLFVAYIFLYQHRLRKNSERLDTFRFRIRELVVKPNLPLLHSHFSGSEIDIDSFQEGAENMPAGIRVLRLSIIKKFKKRHLDLMYSFSDPLIQISPEFRSVSVLFSQLEDAFTNCITADIKENDIGRMRSEIRRLRGAVLAELFAAEARVLENKDNFEKMLNEIF